MQQETKALEGCGYIELEVLIVIKYRLITVTCADLMGSHKVFEPPTGKVP